MYEYIIGRVVNIKEEYIVIDNNKIGYKIFTSKNSLKDIEINKEIVMYIYFNLRDDGINLYGFTTEEELDMFNMLILVSRIGPKVGLGILSTLTPDQIKLAIINNNSNVLCEAPGIGTKTASRIILELKDKLPQDCVDDNIDIIDINDNNIEAAINGIMSLGYTRGEIVMITNNMNIEDMNTEDIMREVLKRLST